MFNKAVTPDVEQKQKKMFEMLINIYTPGSEIKVLEGAKSLNQWEYTEKDPFQGCKSLKELHLPESLFVQFVDSDTKELVMPEYSSNFDWMFYGADITLLCEHGSLAEQFALGRKYPIKYI